jgi:hypothetical protein
MNAKILLPNKRTTGHVLLFASLVALALTIPAAALSDERLKIIYSQFTMTNSATWFAREAGLFERHGLTADLMYRR